MAYYNKIGLLVLNENKTKFLVCQKSPENVTGDYIMPGGQNEEGDDIECLKNEIKQELNCEVDIDSIEFVGEYTDVAAGKPDRDVSIRLYQGKILGNPIPTTEIKAIHWIGIEHQTDRIVSPIIRNKIIPDLVQKGILNEEK